MTLRRAPRSIVGRADRPARREANDGSEVASMILPQLWRKLLLSAHVATTVSVLGADLVLLTLAAAGLLGADPRTIYPAAQLVAARLVAPLAVASLGTGLLLGLLTPWGLLTYWWVTLKLGITAVLTSTVLLVLVPRLGRAAAAAVAAEPLTDAQRLPLVAAPAAASALLVLAVVLAVFKPGWRLRPRSGG
jgi:hypothetical protein